MDRASAANYTGGLVNELVEPHKKYRFE